MVIVELIASISITFAFLSAIVFAIVHMKNKQTIFKFLHHRSLINQTKDLPIVEVIKNEEIESISTKYGIQWTNPMESIVKSIDFEQGDSVSFSDQTMSVRELIIKFENNFKEKNNQTDSDVTSLETNFDNRTIKNQMNYSHHSSISNLDVTIPSNLSSTIDLERFECISTTSNLSEFLTMN